MQKNSVTSESVLTSYHFLSELVLLITQCFVLWSRHLQRNGDTCYFIAPLAISTLAALVIAHCFLSVYEVPMPKLCQCSQCRYFWLDYTDCTKWQLTDLKLNSTTRVCRLYKLIHLFISRDQTGLQTGLQFGGLWSGTLGAIHDSTRWSSMGSRLRNEIPSPSGVQGPRDECCFMFRMDWTRVTDSQFDSNRAYLWQFMWCGFVFCTNWWPHYRKKVNGLGQSVGLLVCQIVVIFTKRFTLNLAHGGGGLAA